MIGAGLAGLVAARTLARRGVRVTVFEREAVPGGLVSSFELLDGLSVERTHHFIYPGDRHLLDLAHELGLADRVRFGRSSVAAHCGGRWWPLTGPLDLLRFAPMPVADRLRSGVVAAYLQRVENWRPLSRTNALAWMSRHNGRAATRLLWEPLLRSKFGSYADQIPMAWLWHRIKLRQDSRRLLRGERLGYLTGGFARLVAAIEEELRQHGARVRLRTPVGAVGHDTRSGPYLVAGSERWDFDAIGATVATPVFADLLRDHSDLPPGYLDGLRRVPYLVVVEMAFTTARPLSSFFWHQIQEPDPPFLMLISPGNLVGAETFGGRHVHYVGTYLRPDDESLRAGDEYWRERWLAALERLFPAFSRASVLESHLFHLPEAQHVPDLGYEDRVPLMASPVPGVHLSSFAQIYPQDRGLDCAVREGNRLAQRILLDLAGGRPRKVA